MTNYYERDIPIEPSLCDADGKLSIWQAFNIFMDAATDHAALFGVGWKDLSGRGLFWLTVKTKVVLEDRPKMDESATVVTWVDAPNRLRADRNYELRQDGRTLIRAVTEWAVLDTASMKLLPAEDIYPDGLEYGRPSACPEGFVRIKDRFEEADKYAEYTVRSTDIDIGGHMNNVAYVRALLGTFTCQELRDMAPTSFDVLFRNSVYEGDVLEFYKQPSGNGLDIRAARGDMTALLVHME